MRDFDVYIRKETTSRRARRRFGSRIKKRSVFKSVLVCDTKSGFKGSGVYVFNKRISYVRDEKHYYQIATLEYIEGLKIYAMRAQIIPLAKELQQLSREQANKILEICNSMTY